MVGGAKRKNETLAVKASKATKVDLKNLKNNTKEQLISKLQTLQSENEVLREHNETKTEKIEELERKMEIMQHKGAPLNLEKISVRVQTEDMNICMSFMRNLMMITQLHATIVEIISKAKGI